MQQDTNSPMPLIPTPALSGQECFLYTYVLLREELNGVIGLMKVVSTHGVPQDCINDFKRAAATNKNCPMKWNETGKWIAIRKPETDTDGTIDIVKLEHEEDDFFGEKLDGKSKEEAIREIADPAKNNGATISRENIANNNKGEALKDRGSIQAFKDDKKARAAEEKKVQLRKQALQELEDEVNNQETLAAYAQLHWKRLTQKSAIQEYQDKVKEAQASLMKTIVELKRRDRAYPEYQHKWVDEIRRIKNAYMKSGSNPVDEPIANLGSEDDEKLAGAPIPTIEDPFDSGIGVEAKPVPEAENANSNSISNNVSLPTTTDSNSVRILDQQSEKAAKRKAARKAEKAAKKALKKDKNKTKKGKK